MKDIVKDEIKNILKEKGLPDELDHILNFKYRTIAAKRIYEGLSDDERTKIDRECEDSNTIPPQDVQQR
jgi:hypothetical protein